MNARVGHVEVGARDGLQNEKHLVSTEDKVELITRMLDAGSRRIEVASFVNPKRVPQMADGEAVVAALPDRSGVSYIGLVLNMRGLLRAVETREGGKRGVDEAGCVIMATDESGRRNQGQTIAESLDENRRMLRFAKENGLYPQLTISVAFGCPFEGAVAPQRVADIAGEMAEAGTKEIALGDTIGVAVPAQVEDVFGRVRDVVGKDIGLRAHFHDTRGVGLANAWAAYRMGVETLDSSLGGLGGCPFAPGATGNISTEDLVYMLEQSGVDTGLDLERLIAANQWMTGVMEKPLPSLVSKAGLPKSWKAAVS